MGIAMHRNNLTASLQAITSALNRALRDQIISLSKTTVPIGTASV